MFGKSNIDTEKRKQSTVGKLNIEQSHEEFVSGCIGGF